MIVDETVQKMFIGQFNPAFSVDTMMRILRMEIIRTDQGNKWQETVVE